MSSILQPLLGGDKSNPLLEVMIDSETPDQLLIFFATELLETVPKDRESVLCKMLGGRLYNAGFNRQALSRSLGWSRPTLRRFGEAMKRGCLERMEEVFAGRHAARKFTAVAERFVRRSFPEAYAEHGCHINTFLRGELTEKLNVDVSREVLRPIINEEKAKLTAARSALPVLWKAQHDVAREVAGWFAAIREPKVSIRPTPCSFGLFPGLFNGKNCKRSFALDSLLPGLADTRQSLRFVHHAGLVLIRADLDRATAGLEPAPHRDRVRQWAASVLCGAVNIEQTGQLSFEALSLLIGPCLRSDYRQRTCLHEISTPEAALAVWHRNATLVGAPDRDTFLYDPHGIRYTGALKLLRGWLGSLHMVTTVYYQDFVHTEEGYPAIAFLADNYDDMRDRLEQQMEQFRRLLWDDPHHPITLVVDRAVYNRRRMVAYREVNITIITWEKGGGQVDWAPGPDHNAACFGITRYRNNSTDTIVYSVEYYSELWEKEPSFRRFVVRLRKGPELAPVNLAVLCTDPDRPAEPVLRPLLRRWLQENDILYGINNFGYNQITSYKSVSYQELAEDVTDRQTANPSVRRLTRERAEVRDRWGRLLVERKRRAQKSEQFVAERQTEIDTIDKRLRTSGTTATEKADLETRRARLRTSLKAKRKREQRAADRSTEQEVLLQEQLAQLENKVAGEAAEISRLELLIEADYRRLNFGAKWYFDATRVMARNLFGTLHGRFRPLYENYRNDHQLLRELVRAPGIILESPEQTTVILLPGRCFSSPQRTAIDHLLASVETDLAQTHPGKPIRIRLFGSGPDP